MLNTFRSHRSSSGGRVDGGRKPSICARRRRLLTKPTTKVRHKALGYSFASAVRNIPLSVRPCSLINGPGRQGSAPSCKAFAKISREPRLRVLKQVGFTPLAPYKNCKNYPMCHRQNWSKHGIRCYFRQDCSPLIYRCEYAIYKGSLSIWYDEHSLLMPII